MYYLPKIMKNLQGKAVKHSSFGKKTYVGAGSVILHSTFGNYSYCGYDCTLIHCTIGNFTSIADRVVAGLAHHTVDWVSTSPAFYLKKHSSKKLAKLSYDPDSRTTVIGSDVWIGEGAFIKDGLTIGDGAVIGMGSVVTKDVPPYAIVAGNPAGLIRMRFDEQTVESLLASKWWTMSDDELGKISHCFDRPEACIEMIRKTRESIE